MPSTSAAEFEKTTYEIDDFECVRNADGAWLLVVPDLPSAITDNPLASTVAGFEGDYLVVGNSVVRLIFTSLIASQTMKAIFADKPAELLLCVVNDDGMRTYSRSIPFQLG